ncbi:hypothetical protein KAU11_09060 [Candidatus Babeliales bacterium]|nr:hypothetical protein [Candidatus Babeliales bacterium]
MPSYVQPNSKFKFNPQTSFSYNPTITNNNLIVLQDETSCLHFNGSYLKTINNDLRLTNGLLYLDNNAIFNSYKENELTFTYSQSYGYYVWSVDWSPDGNYLAIGGNLPSVGHDEIEIYSFNGSSLSLTYSQNYGNGVSSVNWSPDGDYLAVGGESPTSGHDEIEIYSFDGSTLSLTYSQNYGNFASSVNWSPDGKYLAVGGNSPDSGDEIQIYSFDGSSLSLIDSQNYGYAVYSFDWSPDVNYLAVGGRSPNAGHKEIEIYYFDGSSLSFTYSQNYGDGVSSVDWSSDGNYLAVGGKEPDSGHEIQIYYFNGSTLSLTYSQNYGDGVSSVNWSPDGNHLAVGGETPDSGHDEIEIYSFDTTNSSLSLSSYKNYGTHVLSVDWSPDGNYLAIGGNGPDSGDEIEIYSFTPITDGPYNITLGNSTLGPKYDLDIKVLGESRVSLDYCNLIYDNTGTTSKTFDFVNRNSSLILDTNSTFSINRNNIKGWHQQSILRQEGHDNSWTISNTTYGYGTGEIKPGGHLLENNSNAIINIDSLQPQIDNNLNSIKYNSNAILLLENKITNTYFDLLNKTTNNSNAILNVNDDLQKQITNNSNAIAFNKNDINLNIENIENNSNTIISLDTEYDQFDLDILDNTNNIKYNSDAIIELYNDDDLIIYNSNAIVTLDNKLTNTTNYLESLITYNSNAIIHDYEIKDDLQNQIQTNSNKIIYNSNAIIKNNETIVTIQNQIQTNSNNIIYNSNSIVSLNINTDTATNNSNDIITLRTSLLVTEQNIEENSNTVLYTKTKLTNTYQDISNQIKYNSNAIIKLQNDEAELSTNNSNAILLLGNKIKYNSNAIIHSYEIQNLISNEITQNSQDIKENSNAIVTIKSETEDLIISNSNFALTLVDEITYNSNAIIHDYELKDLLATATTQNAQAIKENSNAILHSSETTSLEQRISDNTDNIKNNSNTIISSLDTSGLQAEIDQNKIDIRTNSNSLLTIKNNLDQSNTTALQKITNNSNAIINDYEIKKDLQEQIWNNTNSISQNSNAILNNQNIINNNIDDIKNNSNAILNLNYNFETQINNNSNAIIHIYENVDQIKHNSNAIISLQTDLLEKIKNNSNAILENKDSIVQINQDVNNNSNAILLLETKLTNTYIELNNEIKNNSNAIIHDYELKPIINQDIINNSNAIIKLNAGANPAALQSQININKEKIKNNSNTILYTLDILGMFQQDIENNSNAIITLEPKIEESKESTILTKEPITGDIELDVSIFIHPDQIIEIADNATIDGKGAVVLFGGTDYSQFKVQADKTVTLKNIQLLRINQKTFDLKYKLIGTQLYDGQIKIGKNVLFALSENITFSQGLIEILNNDQGESQLFHIKGIEGQKQFKIEPSDEYSNALSFADNNLTWVQRQFGMTSGIPSRLPDRFTQNGTVPVLIKCNNNTFGIQNINLGGFEHIIKSTIGNYTGALGLLGEADVDIGDDTFTDFEQNKNIQEKYDMVFVTQNLNNSLRILKDDLKLTGQLQFADFGENVLHIDSVLTERIKPKVGAPDPRRNIPQINFATNFVQLTSAYGMGRLIFDDNRIRINNDENGFIAYQNSFLGGHTIEVTGDPIWDLYDPSSGGKEFVLDIDELIGLDDINNQPIISEFYSSLKNADTKRAKTAIDLIYEKELAKLIN